MQRRFLSLATFPSRKQRAAVLQNQPPQKVVNLLNTIWPLGKLKNDVVQHICGNWLKYVNHYILLITPAFQIFFQNLSSIQKHGFISKIARKFFIFYGNILSVDFDLKPCHVLAEKLGYISCSWMLYFCLLLEKETRTITWKAGRNTLELIKDLQYNMTCLSLTQSDPSSWNVFTDLLSGP